MQSVCSLQSPLITITMMSCSLVKYDYGSELVPAFGSFFFFFFFSLLNLKFCSYITVPIFTLICIISSTVGGKLQLSVKPEVREATPRIAQHVGLVTGELSLGFRDMALCSLKKGGSAWPVCHYRPTDVKGSVTCLVKGKEFEGRGEREGSVM